MESIQLKDRIQRDILTREVHLHRKEILQPLIDYLQNAVNNQSAANLNFICTHNSRRSHLAQVWSQVAAYYYGIKLVNCYSGGTEITAVYPTIIETFKAAGFRVLQLNDGVNPIYALKYTENSSAIISFSKHYTSEFNPQSDFAAILTCSHADENCPLVQGSTTRIPVSYEDPKAYDGQIDESLKYKTRSFEIAAEMFYVFSEIRQQHFKDNF